MDPRGITPAAVGITDSALSQIVELLDHIHNMAQAKEEVQDVELNLTKIQRVVASLKELSFPSEAASSAALEDLKKVGVAEAVNACGAACESFTKSLKQWTKHSTAANIPLQDQFAFGILNKEKVRSFKSKVQSYQATVNFAVSACQFRIQIRFEKTSEEQREMTKRQLLELEATIRQHLEATDQKLEDTQKHIQELQKEPEDEDEDEDQSQTDAREHAVFVAESEIRALDACRVSGVAVLAQGSSGRTGLEIGDVTTSLGSHAVVGIPDHLVGHMDASIGKVITTGHSSAIVGVYNGDLDVKDFLKR